MSGIDLTILLNALPDDLKPKGSAKLPILLLNLGSNIPNIIQPSLDNVISQYNITSDVCPDVVTLQEIINQRNNIVEQLNNIGVRLNVIGVSITGVSNFLNIILTTITTLDITSLGVSLASKFIPSPPGVPGVVVSGLNDIQTAIRKITFDQYGDSKLAKIKETLSSAALVISIIGAYVLKATSTLKLIDNFVLACDQYSTLIPQSPEITALADSQLQAQSTQNQSTYQGFIIEIEEVPYTPTVKRRRALGKNAQGIVLIQTELSFTTDDQTLISELKLIIDRDNLKAY
jgi:hypothetical protein